MSLPPTSCPSCECRVARAGAGRLDCMNRTAFPLFVTLFVTASIAAANPKPEETWPGFRGHGMSGIAPGSAVPEKWSATENVRWKVAVPGQGWSSPIVWGDTVFLTSASAASRSSSRRPGSTATTTSPSCRRRALGRRGHAARAGPRQRDAGRVRRDQIHGLRARRGDRQDQVGAGSAQGQAVRRPASQEHLRVGNAVHRRRAALRLVRPERRPLLLHARRQAAVEEALAAAAHLPRLRHRLVADGSRRARLSAARQRRPIRTSPRSTRRPARNSGARPGRAPVLPRSSWTTPFVWKNEKRTEIVTLGHAMVLSYGLDGKELWRVTGMSMPTASPLASNGWLYVGSGSQGDANRPFLAIKPGASGDISLADGATSNDFIAWRQPRVSGYTPSAHRARRTRLSRARHRHPRRAQREDRRADLQGARRRRRPHVLGVAGRRGQPRVPADRRRRRRSCSRAATSTRRLPGTISTRCRSRRRPSPAARSTSGRSRSCIRSGDR